ncbi:GNAT family N-acetyltransferase [Veillonella rodentium]|uniref:Predicted acetyltransferase involved in intracellular survival and related acetyltransferases n=1 Tax=Veillonella rodentium TaxID=248315 RepID=A0A239ZV28_9FIRM|nr:GNAT family N-acetyltransferase [Veillonella rodentium]SNV74618.1 Predicted acetyltransferase involved in intracellular survival and related acetyltransferases [Veillonella rodentium]
MEFRIATAQDTLHVENLWAYCFEPKEDPFFQYYFSNCYEPENTVIGVEQGQLLSTVHLRQYNLNVRGAVLPTSYMVGVATHPAARRGGVGGALLTAALEELRKRGQAMTILMPSKASFYQQYGWELYAHQWVQTMPLEELRPLTDKLLQFGLLNSVDQWTLLDPVYKAYTKGLCGYAERGEKEWTRLLGSFFAEGVNVAVVHNDEGVVEGYAVYRLGQPEIPVTEFVYTTRRAQRALLNYFYNHRSQGTTIRWNEGLHDTYYRFYPDGKTGHTTMPYMMSRIVDVKTALEAIPVNLDAVMMPISLTFAVKDSLCSWNKGLYEVQFGASLTPSVKKLSKVVDEKGDITIEVGALSQLLMGTLSARDLAFEGKLEGGAEWLDYFDILYPIQKTYINEWW